MRKNFCVDAYNRESEITSREPPKKLRIRECHFAREEEMGRKFHYGSNNLARLAGGPVLGPERLGGLRQGAKSTRLADRHRCVNATPPPSEVALLSCNLRNGGPEPQRRPATGRAISPLAVPLRVPARDSPKAKEIVSLGGD